MKKLLFLLVVLFMEVPCVEAQTYRYKYLYSINENEEKYVLTQDAYMYVTFFNNGQSCSFSDKYGGNLTNKCDYKGSSNGIIRYEGEYNPVGFVHGNSYRFYFSTDYKRMNFKSRCPYLNGYKWTDLDVYERVAMPSNRQDGEKLY